MLCESMHLSTTGVLEKQVSLPGTPISTLSFWRDPAPSESSNELSPFTRHWASLWGQSCSRHCTVAALPRSLGTHHDYPDGLSSAGCKCLPFLSTTLSQTQARTTPPVCEGSRPKESGSEHLPGVALAND